MHIIHQKAEYYWIGKKSIDNLITSLWIADGKGLKTFTNLLLGRDFDYNTYNQDVSDSEPSTPTTPGFLSSSSVNVADMGRPYSLGYRMGPDGISPSNSMGEIDECSKWRTSDFDNLNNLSIYIPLDFYPLCKSTFCCVWEIHGLLTFTIAILLDKGIIVGIEQNISYRDSLGFVLFKMSPKVHKKIA